MMRYRNFWTHLGSITERDKGDTVIWSMHQPQQGQNRVVRACLPSFIVAMIVLSECFTTSSTLRPVLSACSPFAGSPGIGASELIEPDTSITQQISNGARLAEEPWSKLVGCLGGVRVMRSLCSSGSAERQIVTKEESVVSTQVDMEETEIAEDLICMVVGEQDSCKAPPSHIQTLSCRLLCMCIVITDGGAKTSGFV